MQARKTAKRVLSLFLTVVMTLCIIPLTGVESSAAYENTYANTGNQRADIIGVAKTQIGNTTGSKYTFGAGNVSWCAYFIVWCARQANIDSSIIKTTGWADADDLGVTYYARGSYTPKSGDIIIFDYPPYSTKTPASSYGDHVGLVEYVEGSYVHTIEGNAGSPNAVRRYSYALSNSSIKGYGVPNYKGGSSPSCNCSTSYAGNYICTTSSAPLTIRSGHGTSYSAIGSIPSGATVYVSKADGSWAHVTYNGVSGYASMEYLKKLSDHAEAPTIKWWISDSEWGSTPSTFKQGNRYYLCYKLYDSVTGKDWNSVSSNNYKVKITFYYPDGSVFYSNETTNDDSSWISSVFVKTGTFKYGVEVSGDFIFSGKREFYVEKNPKTIVTATDSVVSLTRGSNETADFWIWTTGYHDKGTLLRYDVNNNNISCSWGEWTNGMLPLKIVAKHPGDSVIKLSILEEGTYKELYTTNVLVHVDALKYSINYSANGGTGAPPSQTKLYGEPLILSSKKPTKTGYLFTKWSSEPNGGRYTFYPEESYTNNASMTLYAQYTPIQYTVKYNANGGTGSMANSSHTYDTAKALTANTFTRTGYTFLGWSTGATATSAKYTDKASVKNLTATNGATVTLYAVWQPNRYTVVTNANGGTGTALESTFGYDTIGTLPSNSFTRTGYTFLGWSTSPTATAPTYTNAQSVKNLTATNGATITLYAVWKANTYTVAYNANGGTGSMSSSSHTYDTAKALTANTFTRTGYTFLGWSTSPTATTATYTNAQSVKNLTATNGATVTLYAVWKKTAPATAYGDANGDGMVDAGDAVLVSRYDAGEIALTTEQLKACDVNGDGIVDAGDAVLISRYDAGLINFFPVICVTVPELPNVK